MGEKEGGFILYEVFKELSKDFKYGISKITNLTIEAKNVSISIYFHLIGNCNFLYFFIFGDCLFFIVHCQIILLKRIPFG